MPGIFLGNTPLNMVSPVKEVYVGGTKVWPSKFDPSDLFLPGDKGFFWHSKGGGWWQDEAGTIPCTADGQDGKRIDNLRPGRSDYIYMGGNNLWDVTGFSTRAPGFIYNTSTAATATSVPNGGESFSGSTRATLIWGLVATASNSSSTVMGLQAGAGSANMITWSNDKRIAVRVNSILNQVDAKPVPPLNAIQTRCAIFRQDAQGSTFVNGIRQDLTPGFSSSIDGVPTWKGGYNRFRTPIVFMINRELSEEEIWKFQQWTNATFGPVTEYTYAGFKAHLEALTSTTFLASGQVGGTTGINYAFRAYSLNYTGNMFGSPAASNDWVTADSITNRLCQHACNPAQGAAGWDAQVSNFAEMYIETVGGAGSAFQAVNLNGYQSSAYAPVYSGSRLKRVLHWDFINNQAWEGIKTEGVAGIVYKKYVW